jgi:carbamoylphosphate synthase small subunit|tara:strand:- start:266 stop:484 length:219 start_codon:yes stop_codon:yes gene_type:complete
MINKKEANLVSFKVLLTRDNKIMTEFSMLSEDKVDGIFSIDERDLIKVILKKGKEKLKPMHTYLQRELQALK